MKKSGLYFRFDVFLFVLFISICSAIPAHVVFAESSAQVSDAPVPLLEKDGNPVTWWFVFKFNTHSFPGCGGNAQRECLFGGDVQSYRGGFGQQFVYASSANPSLQKGSGCIGDSLIDPIGSTFNQVYNGLSYYVTWNDQFYDDPKIAGCTKECGSPWGHSKGMLAWNDAGEGFVMQVSTPSWPASGSAAHPRQDDGNTLGCVKDDDVEVSQHFFSLKLDKGDLIAVLQALQNASAVTDPKNPQIVWNGGPPEIQKLVSSLGKKSKNSTYTMVSLSSGVQLISKPSKLQVPPWQLVSSALNGVPLRAATWWAMPEIPSTVESTPIACWDQKLGKPGAVQIATTGQWNGTTFGLRGGSGADHNHAKVGVSTDLKTPYVIFGDMNQQGTLSGRCNSSQNGRGGLFFVVKDTALFDSVTQLIQGESAPSSSD